MQIVDFFYMMARENLHIKSFQYGRSHQKGAGNDKYPMIWLDDPVYGQTATEGRRSVLRWTANVDILGIPKDADQVLAVQNAAFLIGLSIPERAQQVYKNIGVNVTAFNFTSLRNYYDDGAAGFRFTYTVPLLNPVDLCNSDYDPTKVFPAASALPTFLTDHPDGCAIFADRTGLPNFNV